DRLANLPTKLAVAWHDGQARTIGDGQVVRAVRQDLQPSAKPAGLRDKRQAPPRSDPLSYRPSLELPELEETAGIGRIDPNGAQDVFAPFLDFAKLRAQAVGSQAAR